MPAAAALDLLVIALLLVAAHGAYSLARRLEAGRPGAILAGLAFAGSGYFACQLKHLSIVSTVVWLPVGLVMLDRALARPENDTAGTSPSVVPADFWRRMIWVALFGLVLAEQVLSGFPQSAYTAGLSTARSPCSGHGGSASASVTCLPALSCWRHLASPPPWQRPQAPSSCCRWRNSAATSDRSQALGWEWATFWQYWPPNILTFVKPYIYGDISDATYRGRGIFWEDYGYIGLVPFVLAVYGGIAERRRPSVRFFVAMTVVAYLFVLGPSTPVFTIAYHVVPGMSTFRLPTRFLIVVELGLAISAAVGLTRLHSELTRRSGRRSWLPGLIVGGLCIATAVDLFIHQPRQNPMVGGEQWLRPPDSVLAIRRDRPDSRTYTPQQYSLHIAAFDQARGWTTVEPYFRLRDVLQPNLGGGYWGVASADCYAGIAPQWHVTVWGDHNRRGLASFLTAIDVTAGRLTIDPALPRVLATFGVTHVLSAFPTAAAGLSLVSRQGTAYIYRVADSARVRVVGSARAVANDNEASTLLASLSFDPHREVLLHGPLAGAEAEASHAGRNGSTGATIVSERSSEIVIEATAGGAGYLVLADTYYPGWVAYVDDEVVPIARANITSRAIALPKGRHTVRFVYEAPAYFRGLRITTAAVGVLLLWLGTAIYFHKRGQVGDVRPRAAVLLEGPRSPTTP